MAIHRSITPAVVALAGRRIDAQDADTPRFPLTEEMYVARKILRRFRQERVERLICAAACGADILALEAAEKLAIPATIVLPFAAHIFRNTSVTDRGGNWGERFDHLVATARARNDLVELGLNADDENAFIATNERIVRMAKTLKFHRQLAFVIWEGRSRGEDDSTAEFLCIALSSGFEKKTVLTNRRSRY